MRLRLEQSHLTTWGGWQKVLCRAVYRSVSVWCVCVRVLYVSILSPYSRAGGGLGRESHPAHMTGSLRRQSRFKQHKQLDLVCVCVSTQLIFTKFQHTNTYTQLRGHNMNQRQHVHAPKLSQWCVQDNPQTQTRTPEKYISNSTQTLNWGVNVLLPAHKWQSALKQLFQKPSL